MAKFKVVIVETLTYVVEVETDSEDRDQVGEQALEVWAQSEDPVRDFSGMGTERSVAEVDRVE
jgi:hypothetical protein